MKTKIIFAVLAVGTVFTVKSQDTTNSEEMYASVSRPTPTSSGHGDPDKPLAGGEPVELPLWMAREIALDLSEKEHLEALQEISVQEIALLKTLVQGLEKNSRHKSLQQEFLQRQIKNLEISLKTEAMKKPRNDELSWLLGIIGALGLGYMIGEF